MSASRTPAKSPDAEARARRMESLLPSFSLSRRVTVLVLVAALLVLGVVATVSIPVELIPSGFSPPFLRVTAPWEDAPPQEMLDKITLPLEEELSTVRGIDSMFSFAQQGFTQVFMSFKHGTDMDIAYREVRDRVERAKPNLPEDLEQVLIRKDDAGSMPVAMVGLTIEDGTTDVYDLIQNEVMLPLERIDGVATVEANGLLEKEVLIELDRERVEAAGLNIFSIAQDLAQDNFTMASGNVRDTGRKLLLRSVARYPNPGAVEELQIAPSVKLGDIAEIRYEEPEFEFSVRVNSTPAYAVMVMKEGEANSLEVADRVNEAMVVMRENPRLANIEIDTIMSQAIVIRESLGILLGSGRVGAIFALIVLFFFLRRIRMSLIIALSIPLSMVVALVTMYFAGETLNVLSLLGLMISVGLLVDNAVVVGENIHRIYKQGDISRKDATIRGAGEIAMAITTATLTTMIVFLPVSLVDGMGQFFLLRLAIPIAVSLAASLLVALVVVPLAVYLTLPSRSAEAKETFLTRAHDRMNDVLRWLYERSFGMLNRLYQRILRYGLRRRLDVVLALVAVFLLTNFLTSGVGIVGMSQDDQSFLELDVSMPRNVSFEETQAYFRRVENMVATHQEELGIEFYVIFHRRNWGELQVSIDPERQDTLSAREMTDFLAERMPEMPGIEVHTGQESQMESDDHAVEQLTLFGEDADLLEEIGDSLESVFTSIEGVIGVQKSGDDAPNELALVLDRDRAQRQNVNPEVLAGMVGYALRGQPLPRLYLNGRDIPVRVRFEEEDRESLAELKDFSVPTQTGEMLALASLVSVEQVPTRTRIFRRNKQTARRITLELEEGSEEDTRARIYAIRDGIDLPEGVFWERRAVSPAIEEFLRMMYAALLSIVFVYLLMGFLFESFLLPLAILVTIPLANLGVRWMHAATGRDIDGLGLVGLIILIGVVVNNGIVLLDYVNRLRAQGMRRTEALMLASERRFRPIMMTALTTICGMVPLTLGQATRMGLSYKSFGLTLIGGMMTASLLTLLVVPVSYTLFEDAREWTRRAIFGKREDDSDSSGAGDLEALPAAGAGS